MKTNYHTDSGHYLSIEDSTQYILFIIPNLRRQNYSDIEIIEFEDNEMLQTIANNIITTPNKGI